MKIVKKNQIVILVIALMLVSAGYLSYMGNRTNEEAIKTTSEIVDQTEVAGIGDAKLVNANVEISNQVEIVQNEETNNENETKTKTVNTKDVEEYFSSSRLNREKMYSQMIESYQKILESESINETQKAIAQTEIQNINNMKNKIMICENLIKTKGIEDLIIFVNDQSVSVIVKKATLEQEQIAQIQNIIEREMKVDISDIHISNK